MSARFSFLVPSQYIPGTCGGDIGFYSRLSFSSAYRINFVQQSVSFRCTLLVFEGEDWSVSRDDGQWRRSKRHPEAGADSQSLAPEAVGRSRNRARVPSYKSKSKQFRAPEQPHHAGADREVDGPGRVPTVPHVRDAVGGQPQVPQMQEHRLARLPQQWPSRCKGARVNWPITDGRPARDDTLGRT